MSKLGITKCQALHWSRRKDIYSYIPIDRNAIAPWNCVIGEHPISTLTLKDDDLFLITDTLGNISDLSCRLGEIEDSVLSAKIWPCSAMFSGYFADQSARCGGAVVLCAVWKISKKWLNRRLGSRRSLQWEIRTQNLCAHASGAKVLGSYLVSRDL